MLLIERLERRYVLSFKSSQSLFRFGVPLDGSRPFYRLYLLSEISPPIEQPIERRLGRWRGEQKRPKSPYFAQTAAVGAPMYRSAALVDSGPFRGILRLATRWRGRGARLHNETSLSELGITKPQSHRWQTIAASGYPSTRDHLFRIDAVARLSDHGPPGFNSPRQAGSLERPSFSVTLLPPRNVKDST